MTWRSLARLLAPAVPCLLAACDGIFTRERAILLPVQSIEVPATFTPGSPFTVTLTVVAGGCRSFERLDGERAGDRLVIRARGHEVTGPDVACPADIRYEPRAFTVQPPFGDSIVVVASQPGQLQPLERVVRPR